MIMTGRESILLNMMADEFIAYVLGTDGVTFHQALQLVDGFPMEFPNKNSSEEFQAKQLVDFLTPISRGFRQISTGMDIKFIHDVLVCWVGVVYFKLFGR